MAILTAESCTVHGPVNAVIRNLSFPVICSCIPLKLPFLIITYNLGIDHSHMTPFPWPIQSLGVPTGQISLLLDDRLIDKVDDLMCIWCSNGKVLTICAKVLSFETNEIQYGFSVCPTIHHSSHWYFQVHNWCQLSSSFSVKESV